MNNVKKLSYKEATLKKEVRAEVFDGFQGKFNKLIGLGGPDLSDYIQFFRKRDFNDISIYERDNEIFIKQLGQISTTRVNLNFSDILHAPYQQGVLYDLDFCCCVTSAKQHIKKFQENTVFTFSLRPFRPEVNFDIFCAFRGEMVHYIENHPEGKFTVYTSGRTYKASTYFDTVTMLMIY